MIHCPLLYFRSHNLGDHSLERSLNQYLIYVDFCFLSSSLLESRMYFFSFLNEAASFPVSILGFPLRDIGFCTIPIFHAINSALRCIQWWRYGHCVMIEAVP